MAIQVGELIYNITGDTSRLNRDLDASNQRVGGLGSAFSGLRTIGVAAIAGIALSVGRDLARSLVTAASAAEETRNRFNVVFSSVSDMASQFSRDLADNYGLSTREAEDLLGSTGDLLTGFGFTQQAALDLSVEVQRLAVDLASFTNFSGGAEGASQALTKALLGETESLKSLGVSVNQEAVNAQVLENAQNGVTFETERQARAFATLQIAQEQSLNAIGDFNRSQDSFANQTRIARAAVEDLSVGLGQALLPPATGLVSVFARVTRNIANSVNEFNRLNEITAQVEAGNEVVATSTELVAARERELTLFRAEADFATQQQLETHQALIASYDRRIEQAREQEAVEAALEAQAARFEAQQQALLDAQTPAQRERIRVVAELATISEEIARNRAEEAEEALTDEQRQLEAVTARLEQLEEVRERARQSGEERETLDSRIIELEQDRLDLIQQIAEAEDIASGAAAARREREREAAEAAAEAERERLRGMREAQQIIESIEQAEFDRVNQDLENDEIEVQRQIRRLEELDEFISQYEQGTETYNNLVQARIMAQNALDDAEQRSADAAIERERELEALRLQAAANVFGGVSELLQQGAEESLALFNINKGVASAQAAINSYAAFTKTLNDGGPFPLNVINAGSILLSGLAQQRKILGASPGGTADASGSTPAVSAPGSTPEMAPAIPPPPDQAVQPAMAMEQPQRMVIELQVNPRGLVRPMQQIIDNNEVIIR